MKRFRAFMIVAACALAGVALPVLAGGFGDGFGGGGGGIGVAGGTIAGQLVLTRDPASTASADSTLRINPATSAANERFLVVQDNGTDVFSVDKEGDIDARGNISNGGSATCFTGVTGVPCFSESVAISGAGDTIVSMRAGTTSTSTGPSFFGSDNTFRHGLQYFGSAHASSDLRNKVFLYAGASGGAIVFGNGSTDVAAGTNIVEERDGALGVNLLGTMDGAGRRSSALYGSMTNCSSSAAPAVCAAAPAGSVTIAAAATTKVVNTTAVTANSQIFVFEDSSLGTKLSVTCNTTLGRNYAVTARTAATSFTITTDAAPTTNPACLSYFIVN